MTTENSSVIGGDLQKHVASIVLDLRTTTGARVMAAAAAIDECEDDPYLLMELGEELIGTAALYEGYDHDYSLRNGVTEFEGGRPVLGWGISVPCHEACLALREHFGPQWLERTLMAGASTISEAKTLLENAQRNYEIACTRRREVRLLEISNQIAQLQEEAEQLAA